MTRTVSSRRQRRGAMTWIARLLRTERGAIAAEFAAVLPVILLMSLGGVELARYVLLHQKLARVASTIGDLVTQGETISEAELTTLFTAVNPVMEPFSLSDDGVVVVSSVAASESDPARVEWQRLGGGTLSGETSKFGSEGATATLPEGFVVRDGENVIVAEVFYSYSPLFTGGLIPGSMIYHRAMFRPRFGSLEDIE